MTAPRARLFVALSAFSLCLLALTLVPAPAHAGEDDFDFAQALAELGTTSRDDAYFDYARTVLNRVIADDNRSEADKDLCRYGLALMGRNEAIGATGNPSLDYTAVLKLFREAIESMEQFVNKNQDHARADDARLKVGETRLAFVQWARGLLESPEQREERGASQNQVQTDAEDMVRGAIRYFDKLRKGHDAPEASQLSQIAQYYWVVCQYYLALVYEPGTEDSKKALAAAALALEDFVMLNEGQLLAIYAQDFMGLTAWEQARAATSDDEKEKFYRVAVEWFGTCIDTPVEDLDSQRIVANGYYHLGQVCNEAGRVGSSNFHRIGVDRLSDMLAQHNTIWRQDNGIRALLELARLELARDRQSEAVEVARQAGEFAKKLGKGWLERQANRILEEIITGRGSGGGGASSADPIVLMRVADSIYSQQKWSEAIAAYQGVIGAVDRTPENAEKFLIRSWRRISNAYGKLGDHVAAAIALEPIHGIWLDGLVDKTTGGKDNPNLLELGNVRLRAQKMWKDLHDLTGATIFNQRRKEIGDTFRADYPNHPGADRTSWNGAMEKLDKALDERRANNSRWRQTLTEADRLFKQVSGDMNSAKQDDAWTFLIYTQFLRQNWDGMLKVVADAEKFWNSPAAKAQVEKFETVASRRKPAQAKARYWKTEAMYRKASDEKDDAKAKATWQTVLKELEGYHADYEFMNSDAGKLYYAGALGHIVFAHIGLGDIPSADQAFKRLLVVDPNYSRLPKVTFALAKHFNDKAKTIDAERKQARIELNGTTAQEGVRTKLRRIEKQEVQVLLFRIDQQGALDKARELVTNRDEKIAAGEDTLITEKQYEEAKAEIKKLEPEIAKLTQQGNELTAQREQLQKRSAELVEIVKQKAQELYEPLVRAAGYFWEWDKALKDNGLKRDPSNVAIFADLYYKAGLLRPEVEQNWTRSRSLYEDLRAMEGVDDEKQQEAISRLGNIYASLTAAAEPGSDERAQLVTQALDLLQGSMAYDPADNDLVVSLLEGTTVVVPFKYDKIGKTFYFPFPRVSSAAEFKSVVEKMGKAGGPPIPARLTDNEVEKRQYLDAVRDFQSYVNGMRDAEIETTVSRFRKAGFDVRLFARLARSSDEFRLALARIYVESGARENMIKAYNLAGSLIADGTYGVQEYGEDWWAANVVSLSALVTGAEAEVRKAGAAGQLSALATEWIDLASRMLQGLVSSSPDLGDDVRPETRDQMKTIYARIRSLRGRAGMEEMNLLLVKPAAGAGNANGGDAKDPNEKGK